HRPCTLRSSPTRRSSDLPLWEHVLQVHIAGHVAPGNAAQLDGIVARGIDHDALEALLEARAGGRPEVGLEVGHAEQHTHVRRDEDRKSTRLNSSHQIISY